MSNDYKADQIFGYYIDLEERGDFQADVRNAAGETVFEVRAGASLGEDETSLIDDGYMRDTRDLDGLAGYLVGIQVLPAGATLMDADDFEKALEESLDESHDGMACDGPAR